MTAKPEAFSYRVKVGHIAANPVHVTLAADADECRRLAAKWDVGAVMAFSAELDIARWKRDGVRVSGTVRATVEQPCVVTLEPVVQELDEAVNAIFVPEGSKLARLATPGEGEIVIDADGPDLPETFSGDTLDIGAVAAEFAAMGIDHYPRREGVGYYDHIESDDSDDAKVSPFAALKKLKGH